MLRLVVRVLLLVLLLLLIVLLLLVLHVLLLLLLHVLLLLLELQLLLLVQLHLGLLPCPGLGRPQLLQVEGLALLQQRLLPTHDIHDIISCHSRWNAGGGTVPDAGTRRPRARGP